MTKFWETEDGLFEVQSDSPDKFLLYRRTRGKTGMYYAGTYTSIAEIDDRFGIKLKEDACLS